MTRRKSDVEHAARAFPSPHNSRPARSLTYQWEGHIYQATIGQKRRKYDNAAGTAVRWMVARSGGRRPSGSVVLSIVATKAAVEIWSREPTCGWPNPSLVALDSVLDIDYLDGPRTLSRADVRRPAAMPLQQGSLT
jgi:hypothetical protein